MTLFRNISPFHVGGNIFVMLMIPLRKLFMSMTRAGFAYVNRPYQHLGSITCGEAFLSGDHENISYDSTIFHSTIFHSLQDCKPQIFIISLMGDKTTNFDGFQRQGIWSTQIIESSN